MLQMAAIISCPQTGQSKDTITVRKMRMRSQMYYKRISLPTTAPSVA